MYRRRDRFEKSVIKGSIKPLKPTLDFFTDFQWRDVKRNTYHFGVTFCTVLIIVFSALTVTTIIEKCPIMFWKFGQTNHGEIDAYINPRNSFINYTAAQDILGPSY